MVYELLCEYLTEENFNSDGSPTADDSYYAVVRISSDRDVRDLKAEVKEAEFLAELEKSDDYKRIISADNYIEDTLRIVSFLSETGHIESKELNIDDFVAEWIDYIYNVYALHPIDLLKLNKEKLIEMYDNSDIDALVYMRAFISDDDMKALCDKLIRLNQNEDFDHADYYDGKWKLLRNFGIVNKNGEAFICN